MLVRSLKLIFCIFTLVLLICSFPIVSGAVEYKEVKAEDIIKQIENGEDVVYSNSFIKGTLDLSEANLKTVSSSRGDLKVIESKIEIENSIFEDDVDFSNSQFEKPVNFVSTNFSGNNIFFQSTFFDSVTFFNSTFRGYTNFCQSTFFSGASFSNSIFCKNVGFNDAIFYNFVEFFPTTFYGDVYFQNVLFNGNSIYYGSGFFGDVIFKDAQFVGKTYFVDSTFYYNSNSKNPEFKNTTFNEDVVFKNTKFYSDAEFLGCTFVGKADFQHSHFINNTSIINDKFNEVYFYNTTFSRVSLNDTDFQEMEVYWTYLENSLVFDGRTYVKLIKNFRNIEQFDDADDAYYQYRVEKRRHGDMSFQSKLFDVFKQYSCGYGVRPYRAFGLGSGIVLLFSFIYLGRPTISSRNGKNKVLIHKLLPESLRRFIPKIDWPNPGISRLTTAENCIQEVSLFDAFYFSMVTFATIGYGDWYPKDKFRKWVMIEGFLGWLTLGLFLVTLTNVMIRP